MRVFSQFVILYFIKIELDLGPQGSWIVCCLHLKIEFAHTQGGVSGVASFITTDEHLQLTRSFPMQAMVPGWLSIFSV